MRVHRSLLAVVAVVLLFPGVARSASKPDLTCSIYASALKDFSKLIANGATVSFGGGGPGSGS
jgi:hypothetical protein